MFLVCFLVEPQFDGERTADLIRQSIQLPLPGPNVTEFRLDDVKPPLFKLIEVGEAEVLPLFTTPVGVVHEDVAQLA